MHFIVCLHCLTLSGREFPWFCEFVSLFSYCFNGPCSNLTYRLLLFLNSSPSVSYFLISGTNHVSQWLAACGPVTTCDPLASHVCPVHTLSAPFIHISCALWAPHLLIPLFPSQHFWSAVNWLICALSLPLPLLLPPRAWKAQIVAFGLWARRRGMGPKSASSWHPGSAGRERKVQWQGHAWEKRQGFDFCLVSIHIFLFEVEDSCINICLIKAFLLVSMPYINVFNLILGVMISSHDWFSIADHSLALVDHRWHKY